MKKILITAILSIASLGAYASEISQYSGPYVGLHMGYAQGDFKGTDTFLGADGGSYSYNLSKYLWGGLVGYNKVFDNNILLGIEADYEQRNADSAGRILDAVLNDSGSVQTKIQQGSSLRLRLGKIFKQDKTLAYVTAGYGAVDIKSNFTILGTPFSKSVWQSGYNVGMGVEHMLNDVFSIKGEYRFSDYGKKDIVPGLVLPDGLERTKYENENSVRFGLIYHF